MKEKYICYCNAQKSSNEWGGVKEEAATSKKLYILFSFRYSFTLKNAAFPALAGESLQIPLQLCFFERSSVVW